MSAEQFKGDNRTPKQVRIGDSRILPGQKGVFAEEPIQQGEFVLSIGGQLTHERSKYTLQVAADMHLYPVLEDGTEQSGMYLNHSCDANCRIHPHPDAEPARVDVSARRDIALGEELTLDYALMEAETTIDGIACQCGAASCRHTMTGYNDLPLEVKEAFVQEGLVPIFLLHPEEPTNQ